jgi:inorganic pyrophosphatase
MGGERGRAIRREMPGKAVGLGAAFAAVLILGAQSTGCVGRPAIAPAPPTISVPDELPATAATKLANSLAAARRHAHHVWRDPPAINGDGTVNAYVEIARDDVRKFELDMAANAVKVDRVMPPEIGGYPINYGIVPQTISYDGDPFDALVTGPPIRSGTMIKGIVIALMQMTDEKGLDSKVVLSPVAADGGPAFPLTAADRDRIAGFFRQYKRDDPKTFSTVPGWGNEADGLAYVEKTQAFFRQCRGRPGKPCRVR